MHGQPTLSQAYGSALGLIDLFIALSAQICLVSLRFSLGPAISALPRVSFGVCRSESHHPPRSELLFPSDPLQQRSELPEEFRFRFIVLIP